jgi:hypothetical protein
MLTAILNAGTSNQNAAPLRHCGVLPAALCSANPAQACCAPFSRPLGSVPPPIVGKAICRNPTGVGAPQRCAYAN